jgi:hypothetical protein
MSLRDRLKVACCTPLEMQHATFPPSDATAHATSVQQLPANPHEIRASGATAHATTVQQGGCTGATEGTKLHVASARECNTQPGPLTAHRVLSDLLDAAMRACDQWQDGPEAREQMRQDVMATPEHLRTDLLNHFRKTYPCPK